MEALTASTLKIIAILVALGFVIFVHELGHFLVARWAGVLVERFSIGFGPVLFALRRKDTEYAISLIPLGGYVKMLGQADLPESEVVTEDERSYQNQSVGKRMAIISAGVIMNLILGFVCFTIAYRIGVPYNPSLIGPAIPGKPAWEAGLRAGDRIVAIDGRKVTDFETLLNRIQLTNPPNDTVHLSIDRQGTPLEIAVTPVQEDDKPMIGVYQAGELRLVDDAPTQAHSPASSASNPGFEGGDRIRAVDGQPVDSLFDFQREMFERKGHPVLLSVQRKSTKEKDGSIVDVTLAPNHVRALGLQMVIGEIVVRGVQRHSPATSAVDAAGNPASLQAEDVITAIDGRDDFDPMRLPDMLADKAGKPVELTVQRQGARSREIKLSVVPTATPTWIDFTGMLDKKHPHPLSAPAIGIAYRVSNSIRSVSPGSPAAKADPPILAKDEIKQVEFELERGGKIEKEKIEIGESHWPTIFYFLQHTQVRRVTLTIARAGLPEPFKVTLEPQPDPSWPMPNRGLVFGAATAQHQVNSALQAISLGLQRTHSLVMNLYLYLRGLIFTRTLSVKTLGGPIEIGRRAYELVEDIPVFIVFFGFLSVQLAVINFLPIPVLDGGHMVFLVYEMVTRRRPGERVVAVAHYMGLVFLLGLILFVFGLDIFRWFTQS